MAERFRNNAYRFLRWSERYFKTDMVYLSRGGFWLTLGQVVSIFSLFLLSIVFANSISPETYGVYRYILSVAGMFAVFTLPGMMPAIVRATAQGKDHLIHAATRERATWSLLGVVVALLGAIYYFVNENNVLATALFIVAFFLPFFDTFSLYNAYLVGKKNFKKQTLLHLISQLVSVVFLTTTLFITDNIILILLAYFVPLALVRFILYVYTTKKIVAIPTPKNEENLIYGKHLSAMNVFSAVSTNIDKFLLWHFLGPAQVAIYVFAVAIPEQIKGPLKGLGELALPKFAEKKPDEIRTLMSSLWYKILWYGFFLLITSLVYIVSAPFIFSLFFPQYLDSVIYSQIFSLTIVTGVSAIPMSLLTAQKKIKEQYSINIVQPMLNIILFLIFIPMWGIMGAIIAWTAGRVFSTVYIIGLTLYTFRH